jgi:hypothetical protein
MYLSDVIYPVLMWLYMEFGRFEYLGVSMQQILEWSGMWIVAVGFVIAVLGLLVLIVTDDFFFYMAGWVVVVIGGLILFWSVLRDRLRARKTDDLDDVGFN